jgi:hypothetical protein
MYIYNIYMTAFVYLESGKVVIFFLLCVTPRLLRDHSACLRGAGTHTFCCIKSDFQGHGPKCTEAPGPKAQGHRPQGHRGTGPKGTGAPDPKAQGHRTQRHSGTGPGTGAPGPKARAQGHRTQGDRGTGPKGRGVPGLYIERCVCVFSASCPLSVIR